MSDIKLLFVKDDEVVFQHSLDKCELVEKLIPSETPVELAQVLMVVKEVYKADSVILEYNPLTLNDHDRTLIAFLTVAEPGMVSVKKEYASLFDNLLNDCSIIGGYHD